MKKERPGRSPPLSQAATPFLISSSTFKEFFVVSCHTDSFQVVVVVVGFAFELFQKHRLVTGLELVSSGSSSVSSTTDQLCVRVGRREEGMRQDK